MAYVQTHPEREVQYHSDNEGNGNDDRPNDIIEIFPTSLSNHSASGNIHAVSPSGSKERQNQISHACVPRQVVTGASCVVQGLREDGDHHSDVQPFDIRSVSSSC